MLDKRPDLGQVFRHDRTRDEYVVVALPQIKIEGVWVYGVAYTSMKKDEDNSYVRTEGDFMHKFSRID